MKRLKRVTALLVLIAVFCTHVYAVSDVFNLLNERSRESFLEDEKVEYGVKDEGEGFSVLHKSMLYDELRNCRDDFLKGISQYTSGEIENNWKKAADGILAKYSEGIGLSGENISDFYLMEKEMLNSLLDEKLYDHKSLRSLYDEKSAENIADRLLNHLDDPDFFSSEEIDILGNVYFEGDDGDLNGDWITELTKKIENGLARWTDLENSFLDAQTKKRYENEEEYRDKLLVWDEAYKKLRAEKENWLIATAEKVEEGEKLWQDRKKELDEKSEELLKVFEKEVLDDVNQKKEILLVNENLYLQTLEMIQTSKEAIGQWFSKWKYKCEGMYECWNTQDGTDDIHVVKNTLSLVEKTREDLCDENQNEGVEKQAFLSALNVLEGWMNDLLKSYELKNEQKKKTLDIIAKFSSESTAEDPELEKLKKMKTVLEKQFQIDKAVYEYSQNRTSSQEEWQLTELKLRESSEVYQEMVADYENIYESVKNAEAVFEDAKRDYENQKLYADALLMEYEQLLKKYNDLKYEVSLSQIAKVKNEFVKNVDRLNLQADTYDGSDLLKYLKVLRDSEYENVKTNGKELVNYLTEAQEINTEDGVMKIPSIAELKEIIEIKTRHAENADNEKKLLNEKNKIIEFVETGIVNGFITESEMSELSAQYGKFSIEYVKKQDIEVFKKIFENSENIFNLELDDLNCSDYVRTVLDIYKTELYESDSAKNKIKEIELAEISGGDVFIEKWRGGDFVYEVIEGYEDFVNENSAGEGKDCLYYEKYNTEKNKYAYILDCLEAFSNEYTKLTEEYQDLVAESEYLEQLMSEVRKKYENQVLLTQSGNENSYYDKLEVAFNEYEKLNQALLNKYDEVMQAELNMKIAEAVNEWAASTYLHVSDNLHNPEIAFEKSEKELSEINEKIKGKVEALNEENENSDEKSFSEFEKVFRDHYASKLKALQLYNQYISLESMINEEYSNYKDLFSKMAKDSSFEEVENLTASEIELIKSFVKIDEKFDGNLPPFYEITFNDDDTKNEDLDYLKDYIESKVYTDDFSYISQSRLDAASFLQELETKEYDLNDLMLAVCYLKSQGEEKSLYFEGEDPSDRNNYPFQLPVNKLYSMDFTDAYEEGRLSELENAYNKIVSNKGCDDIARYILYSSLNLPAEYKLNQREIDVIATRGLDTVITKIDAESYKHIINGVGLSLAASVMGAMAAIPMIGAWAIVPAAAALIAAATAFSTATSFKACGDDVRKIRNGYKIILDEYEYYYDSLVEGFLDSKNKLENEKTEYDEILLNLETENIKYTELIDRLNDSYLHIADEKNINLKMLGLYTDVFFKSGNDLLIEEGFNYINDLAFAEINSNSRNSIDVKEYELNLSKVQFDEEYNKWKNDTALSLATGNVEWDKAEKKMKEAFSKWQTEWIQKFDENNKAAKQQYADFLYEKEKWINDTYLNQTRKNFEQYAFDEIFTEHSLNVSVDVNEAEIKDIIDNTVETLSLFNRSSYEEKFDLGNLNHNSSDEFNFYNVVQDTYSAAGEIQKIFKDISSKYSATMAQKLLDDKINDIYCQINSQNETVDKWQKDLVLRDGYSYDGEIWRDAVVDSLVFNTVVRKRQTVHKYEWFECVNPFISEVFDNYSGLDSDAVLNMIQNSMNQIDEWSCDIAQAFNQHIGETPEFVEHVDVKKGRFQNISKNGSGEMGIIMLDYIWNSLENAEGYAQLGTPLYDKKFTADNTFLGIQLPSIRQITDIICDIAANATEQTWLKVFDDAVYALMDMSLQTKTTDQIVRNMGKSVASLALSYGSSAASDALSSVENGLVQFLGNTAVRMTSSYLTDVSSAYIDSMSFEKGFSIDWDRANRAWLDSDVLKRAGGAGASYGVRTAANYGLNSLSGMDGINVPLNEAVFNISAIRALNNSLAQLAGSGTEFAITGKTTLNLLGTKELGMDLGDGNVGFFGITLDNNGVSAAITSDGTYIGLSQILKGVGGIKDALKVSGIKVGNLFGNTDGIALLNAANALGYSGINENIDLAQKLWNKELNLVFKSLDDNELGYFNRDKDGEISVNSKYSENSKNAAIELATVLAHEGTHVNGNLLEALAQESGLRTYLNLAALYGIDADTELVDKMLEAYCSPESWIESDESVSWWKLTANGQLLFDKKGWLVDEDGNQITDEKGRAIGHNEILTGLLNILFCGNEKNKSKDMSFFTEEQKEYARELLLDALISYSIVKKVPEYSGNQYGKKLDMDSIMQNCGNTVASAVFNNYYNNLADLILAREYNVDLGFSPDKTIYPDSLARFTELLESNRETCPDAESLINKYKFTFVSKDKTEYELFKLDKTNPYADEILKQYDVWLNSTINKTGCTFMSVLAVPQLLTGRVLTAKEIEDIWNIATTTGNPPVLKNAAVMDANELTSIVLSYMGLNDFKLEYVNNYQGKQYKNRTLIGERVKVEFNTTGHTTLGNIGGEIIYNPHNTATKTIRRDGVYIYD